MLRLGLKLAPSQEGGAESLERSDARPPFRAWRARPKIPRLVFFNEGGISGGGQSASKVTASKITAGTIANAAQQQPPRQLKATHPQDKP